MRCGCVWAAAAPPHAAGAFHAAAILRAHGEPNAAEAAYREGLSIDPDHQQGLAEFAAFLKGLGRLHEAAQCRRRLAEIEVDRLGIALEFREEVVGFKLAQARFMAPPPRVPPAYVEKVFDAYADTFDSHLVTTLGYRGPALLRQLVIDLTGRDDPAFDTLDVGCGTGLSGVAFRSLSRRLEGIDQSEGMLARARARGVYDYLERGDLLSLVADRPSAYDLLVAADVLVYFGDLTTVFAVAITALRPSAVMCFTLERGDEPGFVMNGSGRYSHAAAYVRETATLAGFADVVIRDGVVRQEGTEPVP